MTCFDEAPMTFDYARYLAAKTTVDDRALNRHVLAELCRLMPAGAPQVLEVGAGLGTMVARLIDWGAVGAGEYILLDADRQLLDCSRRWLCDWAAARGLRSDLLPDGLRVGDLRVRLVHAELGRYLEAAHGAPADVLIANAGLDLVDVPAVLPGLLRLLVPGGIYWFTINYDGESIFEPGHPHDDLIMRAYHRDMDERIRYGRPAGESRTGRRLFHYLRDAGAPALAAGASGRMGTTRAMRLTSCTASSTRSRTRCGIARTGWNRRTWPAGWPSAAGNWPRANWSTSPTSLISWAARPPSALPARGGRSLMSVISPRSRGAPGWRAGAPRPRVQDPAKADHAHRAGPWRPGRRRWSR